MTSSYNANVKLHIVCYLSSAIFCFDVDFFFRFLRQQMKEAHFIFSCWKSILFNSFCHLDCIWHKFQNLKNIFFSSSTITIQMKVVHTNDTKIAMTKRRQQQHFFFLPLFFNFCFLCYRVSKFNSFSSSKFNSFYSNEI